MKSKYKVRLSETYYFEIEVEAESKDDAKEVVITKLRINPLDVRDSIDSCYDIIETYKKGKKARECSELTSLTNQVYSKV